MGRLCRVQVSEKSRCCDTVEAISSSYNSALYWLELPWESTTEINRHAKTKYRAQVSFLLEPKIWRQTHQLRQIPQPLNLAQNKTSIKNAQLKLYNTVSLEPEKYAATFYLKSAQCNRKINETILIILEHHRKGE